MQYGPIIAGIVIIGIGIYLIYLGLQIRQKIKQARYWPTVTGTITKLKTIPMGNKVIGTDDYREYILRVVYEYEINGEKYTGRRAVFGSDITIKAEVDEFCSLYKEGEDAQIYYNPDDYKECLLMPDRPGGKPHREFFFGIIVIITGAIIAIFNGGLIHFIK